MSQSNVGCVKPGRTWHRCLAIGSLVVRHTFAPAIVINDRSHGGTIVLTRLTIVACTAWGFRAIGSFITIGAYALVCRIYSSDRRRLAHGTWKTLNASSVVGVLTLGAVRTRSCFLVADLPICTGWRSSSSTIFAVAFGVSVVK